MSAPPLGRATWIDAHYVLVRYHFAAEVFSTAVVGIQRSRESREAPNTTLLTVQCSASPPLKQIPPLRRVMFAVPDVDAAADMVRQHGGKIVLSPMDSPVCRLAWCIDADGNTFALHRLKDS
jgi:predicted enzyme related to lactoylglutathione lyase